jgi:hypothetical protein
MRVSERKIGLEVSLNGSAYEFVDTEYGQDIANRHYLIVDYRNSSSVVVISLPEQEHMGEGYCRFDCSDVSVESPRICGNRKLKLVNSIRESLGCSPVHREPDKKSIWSKT